MQFSQLEIRVLSELFNSSTSLERENPRSASLLSEKQRFNPLTHIKFNADCVPRFPSLPPPLPLLKDSMGK